MSDHKEYSKSALIDAVCDKHLDIDPRVIRLVIDSTLDTLKTAINVEERVEIAGFGVFGVQERAARAGTMPEGMINSEGVEYSRAVDFTVEFTPSQDFYDQINEREAEG